MSRQAVNDLTGGTFSWPEVSAAGVDNFSLGFWFWTDVNAAALIGMWYNGNAASNGYGIQINSSGGAGVGNVECLLGGIGWFGGGAFTTNQWNHTILIRNAGTSQLYLNGSTLGSSFGNTPNSLSSTENILHAGEANGTMRLAECFIYSRVLTSAERTTLANGYSPMFILQNLERYCRLTGQNFPEPCEKTGASGVLASGNMLTKGEHPSFIRYPGSMQPLKLRPRPFAPGIAR